MNPPCCVLSGIPGWLYDLLQYDQLDAEIEAYMHMRHRFAVCNGSHTSNWLVLCFVF
jgi:hypothetical protein